MSLRVNKSSDMMALSELSESLFSSCLTLVNPGFFLSFRGLDRLLLRFRFFLVSLALWREQQYNQLRVEDNQDICWSIRHISTLYPAHLSLGVFSFSFFSFFSFLTPGPSFIPATSSWREHWQSSREVWVESWKHESWKASWSVAHILTLYPQHLSSAESGAGADASWKEPTTSRATKLFLLFCLFFQMKTCWHCIFSICPPQRWMDLALMLPERSQQLVKAQSCLFCFV